jgi:hypothetical protein
VGGHVDYRVRSASGITPTHPPSQSTSKGLGCSLYQDLRGLHPIFYQSFGFTYQQRHLRHHTPAGDLSGADGSLGANLLFGPGPEFLTDTLTPGHLKQHRF